jgi:ribosomal protein L40E
MPVIFLILVCVVGVGFTVLLCACWLIFTIFRLLASGLESLFLSKPKNRVIAQQTAAGWTCKRPTCRTDNPSHANYCRRCGRAVVVEKVQARVALASM